MIDGGEYINIVSYGGGANSTALLVGLHQHRIPVDLILFADTGAEHPHTYAYLDIMDRWLKDHGMPEITRVYKTAKDGRRLTLEDECLKSGTLPSIAYGFKRCSLKHKIGPQEKFCNNYPPCREVWASGKKVVKFIGYDAGEHYRSDKVLLRDLADPKYSKWYPLMEWGWDREACIRAIKAAGLPQPGKSSCFFCPSMRAEEIIDLLNGSKERVSEAEYWARRRGQMKLDRENAALTATGQQPRQKKFETVKDTLRKQISSVLYRATSFEDFSDKLMQQYGIAVKESRGCLSYLPAGRAKFIRAKHLGDKFDKAAVLATLQANAEHKPKVQFKQDAIGKLIDIQAKLAEGKGTGYERWAKKYNLKAMAQTLILLQEKDLLNEDALNQRIAELETKYHDALAVVKDLEGRMKTNKELRYHVAAYTNTKNIAQQLKAAKRPAAFEEQHRAELTAYRAAAAYFKANDLTKLPSPKKLEAEYAQLASEKAKFYEQYKEAKEELLKLKTAKQNVASFFREEEPAQQER